MEHNSTCTKCGRTFHVRPSAKKYGRGKYCSRKCTGLVPAKIGDIRLRVERGVKREYVKATDGWKRHNPEYVRGCKKKPAKPKPKKKPKPIKVTPKKVKMPRIKPKKKEVKTFARRQEDLTDKEWVRIDSRTVVLKKKTIQICP